MHHRRAFGQIPECSGEWVLRDEPRPESLNFIVCRRIPEQPVDERRQAAVGQFEGVGTAVLAGEAVLVFEQPVAEGDRPQAALVQRQVDIGADIDRAERRLDPPRGVAMVGDFDE